MKNSLVRAAARLLRAPGVLFAAALGLTATASHAQLITVTDDQLGVFDQSSDFRFYDLSAFGGYAGRTISDVSLSVTFGKFADDAFSPPFYQEITLSLIFLDFTNFDYNEAYLIDQFSLGLGYDGDSFAGTIHFDDTAALPVDDDLDVLSPGTYRPVQPLALFSGKTFQPDIWALFIEDIQAGAPLVYASSELRIQLAPLQPVPEPSTYALGGLTLLVGVVALRRFRNPRSVVSVG